VGDDKSEVLNLGLQTRTCVSEIEFGTVGAVPVLRRVPGHAPPLFREDEVCHPGRRRLPLRDQILEYLIPHGLESGWAVGETKEHNQGFKRLGLCGMWPSTHHLPSADIVVSHRTSSLVK